jgi:hypothetical protein
VPSASIDVAIIGIGLKFMGVSRRDRPCAGSDSCGRH